MQCLRLGYIVSENQRQKRRKIHISFKEQSDTNTDGGRHAWTNSVHYGVLVMLLGHGYLGTKDVSIKLVI